MEESTFPAPLIVGKPSAEASWPSTRSWNTIAPLGSSNGHHAAISSGGATHDSSSAVGWDDGTSEDDGVDVNSTEGSIEGKDDGTPLGASEIDGAADALGAPDGLRESVGDAVVASLRSSITSDGELSPNRTSRAPSPLMSARRIAAAVSEKMQRRVLNERFVKGKQYSMKEGQNSQNLTLPHS